MKKFFWRCITFNLEYKCTINFILRALYISIKLEKYKTVKYFRPEKCKYTLGELPKKERKINQNLEVPKGLVKELETLLVTVSLYF